MKTVGIIGGIAPESTIEYYRLIISSYRQQMQDGNYPSIIINSINLKKMLDMVFSNQLAEVTEYVVDELQRLAKAGADFGVLASNTPHIVFDDINSKSPIPLLSIVRLTCAAAKDAGLKKFGLFGTRSTMQAGFYQRVFSAEGMSVVSPNESEQKFIHDKYMNELVNSIFLDETRVQLLAVAERLKEREGIEGLILGGTELPLILREEDVKNSDIRFLDTTRIHVKGIVAELLS